MRLAAALLFLIAIVHYAYDPLASAYTDKATAARGIFYVLRGVEGSALFILIGLLIRRPLVMAICLWGALEEAQTSVCGMAHGLVDKHPYEPFVGLCGAEMYWLGVVIAACLAVMLLDRIGGKGGVG